MDLTGWAEQQGHRRMPGRAAAWLEAQPELVELIRQGRLDGWSWETIRGWLAAEHGFTFTATSLTAACRTVGIL